ncbi:MAG: metal-dependent hydrolase [Elusimicrobiota bacterium]
MYIFGHTGLTAATAHAVDHDVDLRWAVILALAPDLIDKPLSLLLPALVHHNTRSFGHTILFSLFILAALLLWKRRAKPAFLLWGCYTGHFLFDSMWRNENPVILLWPLLGDFPRPVRGSIFSEIALWSILAEFVGLALLVRLARRHGLFERTRLAAYLKSGRLA